MTQMEQAKHGVVTPQIKHVAEIEKWSVEFILQGVADGRIVIPANMLRGCDPPQTNHMRSWNLQLGPCAHEHLGLGNPSQVSPSQAEPALP